MNYDADHDGPHANEDRLMGAREDIARALKEAAASMKGDVKGAIAKLEGAYKLAGEAGLPDDTAVVAEELARAWSRRKAASRSLYYACKATKVAPQRKAAWTTLAKTCELVASRTTADEKRRRAQALYRAASSAFKKAASMTKDAEDKRWLQELANDAARQAKPAEAT
jgi:hypothetical protein